MSFSVLMGNIKHNGCFRTTLVRSPAFTPYHRDLQTTFPGQQPERGALLVSGQNEWLPTAANRRTDTLSLCVSESGTSELSSLCNHISSSGTGTGGLLPPLMYFNTQGGDNASYVYRGAHKLHTNSYFQYKCSGCFFFFFVCLVFRFIITIYSITCQKIPLFHHNFPQTRVKMDRLPYSLFNSQQLKTVETVNTCDYLRSWNQMNNLNSPPPFSR